MTRQRAAPLLAFCLLLGAAFLAGVLIQKYIGVGRFIVAAKKLVYGSAATAPAPQPTVYAGLPEAMHGRLQLFVLAGQSNMSGRAPVPEAQAPHPRLFLFGNDYRWKPALEPVDGDTGQVDLVSRDGAAGLGPGLSFATKLAAARPDLVIGLIPCARGDSTIAEWQRSLNDTTLYGSCLKRIRAASLAGEVAAILFFQGEADALDPALYPHRDLVPEDYAARFTAVIEGLRADLSAPSLPVVFAQIGTQTSPVAFSKWDIIRAQQDAVRLSCSAMITSDDLALQDNVHFAAASYLAIGERFAVAYLGLEHAPDCQAAVVSG